LVATTDHLPTLPPTKVNKRGFAPASCRIGYLHTVLFPYLTSRLTALD
jgi:hypothetical protein